MGAHQRIYRKVTAKNIAIEHACEVGVYLPETSNILDFIERGTRCTLVEPNPQIIEAIRLRFARNANVRLEPVAVYDKSGTITLSMAAASTFISDLPSSPAMVNDRYVASEERRFVAECRVFSDIDDGTIDLLSIDIEGAEWYVLKHMVSRPKVLSIETHGKLYTNPFMAEIAEWLAANNYREWYKDASDTVYCLGGAVELTALDSLELAAYKVYLWLSRTRKMLKRKITG